MRGANTNATISPTQTVRIIPACAGQTELEREALKLIPDHPRMRGANASDVSTPSETASDHPRMRGANSPAIVHG